MLLPGIATQESDENDTYVPASSKEALERAERDNLRVVLPAEDELLIDIDNSLDYEYFQQKARGTLDSFFGVESVKESPSMNGKPGHLHLIVKLKGKVSEMERIALQAAIGSDRKRELLAVVRVLADDPHPSLFLEKS